MKAFRLPFGVLAPRESREVPHCDLSFLARSLLFDRSCGSDGGRYRHLTSTADDDAQFLH